MRIWLDDVRPMPSGFDAHARTEQEAISLLSGGNVAAISLDHDLGDGGSGYGVAVFIERAAKEGRLPRLEWDIHSMNPVGREKMTAAMVNADRFWDERESMASLWINSNCKFAKKAGRS